MQCNRWDILSSSQFWWQKKNKFHNLGFWCARVPFLSHNITLTLQWEVERYVFGKICISAFLHKHTWHSQNNVDEICHLPSTQICRLVSCKDTQCNESLPGILLLAASGSGAVEQAHSLNRMVRKLKSWKLESIWEFPQTMLSTSKHSLNRMVRKLKSLNLEFIWEFLETMLSKRKRSLNRMVRKLKSWKIGINLRIPRNNDI